MGTISPAPHWEVKMAEMAETMEDACYQYYKDKSEMLEQENAKLRAAVEEIYKSSHQVHIIEIARAALGERT